jgi:hypothetical protein
MHLDKDKVETVAEELLVFQVQMEKMEKLIQVEVVDLLLIKLVVKLVEAVVLV